MQNEEIAKPEKLPLGFFRLSERYPIFPYLLGGGVSLMDLNPRASWKWKPFLWLREQFEEAFDRPAPKWFPEPSPWLLRLLDGRSFPLTAQEREDYMARLEMHKTVSLIAKGAEITLNAYKSGGQN